jgi:hypothetical protein
VRTRDGGGRMSSFMQRFPGLGHQPDIVLEGFDGVTTRAGWPTGDGRQSRVRAGLSLLREFCRRLR